MCSGLRDISSGSGKSSDQAGGVHVWCGHIEVQGIQSHGRVHKRLFRIAVRLRQKRIPRARPHCLDHLLPIPRAMVKCSLSALRSS